MFTLCRTLLMIGDRHTSEGFALQFIERESEIPGITDSERLNSTCATWDAYEGEYSVEQEDSGV